MGEGKAVQKKYEKYRNSAVLLVLWLMFLYLFLGVPSKQRR
jgi:hypothetical protein